MFDYLFICFVLFCFFFSKLRVTVGQCTGKTGFFCPCVLFGRNVENLKEEIPWTTPCICHAVFVEGGLALGATTVALHGLNPRVFFLVAEGLLFAWWMCGIYSGLFRQELQRKYHLQVDFLSWKSLCWFAVIDVVKVDNSVTAITYFAGFV